LDIFGEPISLFYKGDNNFTTRIGGCCTLFLMLIILTNLGTELFQLGTGKNFNLISSQENVPLGSSMKQPWVLDTKS